MAIHNTKETMYVRGVLRCEDLPWEKPTYTADFTTTTDDPTLREMFLKHEEETKTLVQIDEEDYERLVGADVREAIDSASFLEARSASISTDASSAAAQSSDATQEESTSSPATSPCSK